MASSQLPHDMVKEIVTHFAKDYINNPTHEHFAAFMRLATINKTWNISSKQAYQSVLKQEQLLIDMHYQMEFNHYRSIKKIFPYQEKYVESTLTIDDPKHVSKKQYACAIHRNFLIWLHYHIKQNAHNLEAPLYHCCLGVPKATIVYPLTWTIWMNSHAELLFKKYLSDQSFTKQKDAALQVKNIFDKTCVPSWWKPQNDTKKRKRR